MGGAWNEASMSLVPMLVPPCFQTRERDLNRAGSSQLLVRSFVPRSLPEFTSQLWRKLWFSVSQLQDKIWEWPGNEAKPRRTYTHVLRRELGTRPIIGPRGTLTMRT